MGEIGAFCRVNGIDASYHQDGYLWAATNEHQRDDWASMVDGLARYGEHPFEVLAPQDVAARTGRPCTSGASWSDRGAIVQPALLARGLRRARWREASASSSARR